MSPVSINYYSMYSGGGLGHIRPADIGTCVFLFRYNYRTKKRARYSKRFIKKIDHECAGFGVVMC